MHFQLLLERDPPILASPPPSFPDHYQPLGGCFMKIETELFIR
jgi:hypothetical protein